MVCFSLSVLLNTNVCGTVCLIDTKQKNISGRNCFPFHIRSHSRCACYGSTRICVCRHHRSQHSNYGASRKPDHNRALSFDTCKSLQKIIQCFGRSCCFFGGNIICSHSELHDDKGHTRGRNLQYVLHQSIFSNNPPRLLQYSTQSPISRIPLLVYISVYNCCTRNTRGNISSTQTYCLF